MNGTSRPEAARTLRPNDGTGLAGDDPRGGKLLSVLSTDRRPSLHEEALYGLAGDIVRLIEPHTEADPAAVLASVLAMFGNAVGAGPHVRIEESLHAPSLYVCVVGGSSSGRKGTSADIARRLVCGAHPDWEPCIKNGLVSGEGVIHAVRDGALERVSESDGDKVPEVIDPGVRDKRLCVVESEFARVLASVRRPDNTLSPVLRELWDHGRAQNLTKNSPERTTGALVSILAHITPAELRRRLDMTEIANGFANRFLFIVSARSKHLPRGGRIPEGDVHHLVDEIAAAVRVGKRVGEVTMTERAWQLWESKYEALTHDQPGLLGELLARGAAQVRRLAMIYALIDSRAEVSVEHLRAALAVWRYAADSARYVFGDRTGDPLSDKLLLQLRQAGAEGLTRDQIRQVVGNREAAVNIAYALEMLESCGWAVHATEPSTGGRPPERWRAVTSPGSAS